MTICFSNSMAARIQSPLRIRGRGARAGQGGTTAAWECKHLSILLELRNSPLMHPVAARARQPTQKIVFVPAQRQEHAHLSSADFVGLIRLNDRQAVRQGGSAHAALSWASTETWGLAAVYLGGCTTTSSIMLPSGVHAGRIGALAGLVGLAFVHCRPLPSRRGPP